MRLRAGDETPAQNSTILYEMCAKSLNIIHSAISYRKEEFQLELGPELVLHAY
jgi:hypothetical protein